MTTVGYGDFSVKTNEARIFAMFACVFGSFLSSLLIITLTNFFNFSIIETKLYKIIEKIDFIDKNTKQAKQVICNLFSSIKQEKGITTMIKEQHRSSRNFVNSITKFKKTTNIIENNDDSNVYNNPFLTLANGVSFMQSEYNKILERDNIVNSELNELLEKIKYVYEEVTNL